MKRAPVDSNSEGDAAEVSVNQLSEDSAAETSAAETSVAEISDAETSDVEEVDDALWNDEEEPATASRRSPHGLNPVPRSRPETS